MPGGDWFGQCYRAVRRNCDGGGMVDLSVLRFVVFFSSVRAKAN